jgi:BolA protein
MTANRVERIRTRLEEVFSPKELEVFDESHLHEGHVGAKDGKGHYRVYIVSDQFVRTRPLERHRMVFKALGEMMEKDIHALSVVAQPPSSPTLIETAKD